MERHNVGNVALWNGDIKRDGRRDGYFAHE